MSEITDKNNMVLNQIKTVSSWGVTGSPNENWRTITLEKILIGRGKHCNFKLDDQSVSREHAVLEVFGRQIFLRDLNSANGTFSFQTGNRQKVDRVPVSLETKIGFGDTGPILVADLLKKANNIKIVANSTSGWVDASGMQPSPTSFGHSIGHSPGNSGSNSEVSRKIVRVYPKKIRCHNCAAVTVLHQDFCDECGAGVRKLA